MPRGANNNIHTCNTLVIYSNNKMQDVQDISRYKLLVWEDIITTPNNLMINITTNVNSRKISFLGLDQPIQRLNRDVGFAHVHCCACNVVASLLPTYPPRNQSRSGHPSVDISQPQKTSNPSHFSLAVANTWVYSPFKNVAPL